MLRLPCPPACAQPHSLEVANPAASCSNGLLLHHKSTQGLFSTCPQLYHHTHTHTQPHSLEAARPAAS